MSKENRTNNVMLKVSAFIVDKRNLFLLIFLIAIVFSVFSIKWVNVENDLTAYLSPETETRRGLELMENEFVTFGAAQFVIANIAYDEAERVREVIAATDGVASVTFGNEPEHYNNVTALYDVTFDYADDDGRCVVAVEELKEALDGYDLYVSTALGDELSKLIADEMSVVIVLVAVVVLGVLLFTSQTYAEIPVLLLTFIVAAVINMGTNFLLGKISFVSNSVTIVLQLALSVDYAIILCNRYKEEHESLPIREAAVTALSKAIPEISASSLTTIGGLIALLFMQFKIGADMGITLIKAVILSILTSFFLMPGLLVYFGKLIDRTRHKSFIPSISLIGKFAYATRRVLPPLFVVLIVGAFYYSSRCPYVYTYDNIETPVTNLSQETGQLIKDNFGTSNMLALIVPSGDYDSEKALLSRLELNSKVVRTLGLSNTEALGGYVLTDRLTSRQFSELTDVDYEAAQLLYAAYAANAGEYGKIIGGLQTYGVPLMDMFIFLHHQIEEGYVRLDDDLQEQLDSAYKLIYNAKLQLQGSSYTRMLVYVDLPSGGDETYEFIDYLRKMAKSYYPGGDTYVVGDSTSAYDFYTSFQVDNVIVSIISIMAVLIVLLFTFRSVGMPLLLIIVIQGSIWINFAIPAITRSDLFFMSYLIVNSIQMGANIDYAIVISNRYMELKNEMPHRDAVINTLNQCFPTIITSGTMMVIAGLLIGQMSSDVTIVGIGQSLGRGTILSLLIVMFVLPQILLLGGGLIEKTSFSVSSPIQRRSASGRVRVDGRVRGTVRGTITGTVHATIDGDVDLNVISATVEEGADNDG